MLIRASVFVPCRHQLLFNSEPLGKTKTMGGRRAKRKRTPPVSSSKKTRDDTYSPPPLLAARRQREAPPSPESIDEQLSGESYFSDSDSTIASSILSNHSPNLPPAPNHPNQNNSGGSQKDDANPIVAKTTIRIPPIFVAKSSDWRKVAPIIFKNAIVSPINISAQATSDGSIIIKTRVIDHFRLIQKTFLDQNIQFKTSKLPEERTLKVVLRGIPIDISNDELKSELELLNFDVKLVKRFGPVNKPMPICLVILGNTQNSKHIYEVSDLFFIKVTVESYKKTGPSQCFACQRIGHGSSNCTHPLRCVKCSGEHKANLCPKTTDQEPTCCNCGGNHTANYRGCPYLAQAACTKPTKIPQPNPSSLATQSDQPQKADTTKKDYASATKPKNTFNSEQVIKLLTDLLSVLSTSDDPKSMLISTINSFITLFANQQ